ncbi:DUF3618 domain-containing protein [Actinomyces vulturis]|uniref:DUF3618 domain-containing protein n=1 Tax=Actinomyces vulturis TaxID=1857645 RepID=UPI0008376A9F|nr:DUF3618 domain-containing protein [Actinomyces vulturis]
MSESQHASTKESVEEIEQRLARQREALALNVDELAAKIDPREQAKALKKQVTDHFSETISGGPSGSSPLSQVMNAAGSTFTAAKEGDIAARGVVAGAALGAFALGRLVTRIIRHS